MLSFAVFVFIKPALASKNLYLQPKTETKLILAGHYSKETGNVMKRLILLLIIPFLFIHEISAQNTEVSGRVTEKNTGNPIPYANIFFVGTLIGTTSDINGNYHLSVSKPGDLIEVSAIGFKKQVIKVNHGEKNLIDFKLEEEVFLLGEIDVKPGENPANIIMKNVFANKEINSPEKFPSWKSRIYAKTEIDLKNVSRDLKRNKLLADFDFVFNYLDSIGSQGKTFLPVFFNETISNYYHDSESRKDREEIIANKASGMKSDMLTQFSGKLYEDVSIYDNYITISEVGMVSPLNNFGLQFYKYYLNDSTFTDSTKIYEISFKPKQQQEPAFIGKIWIEDGSFALSKAEIQLSGKANVNFINNLQYNIEYHKIEKRWVPLKEAIVIDVDIEKNRNSEMLGIIARKTNIYQDFEFKPIAADIKNFREQITVITDAVGKSDEYWNQERPIELEKREKNIYLMVDSIKDVKLFRTASEYVYMFYYGYRDLGKIEFGPYYYLYSANKVEGSRFRIGARTTFKFDKNLRINGFTAYGTKDHELKYGGGLEYYFSVKPLTLISLQGQHDIEMLGKSSNAFMEQNIITTLLSKSLNSKLNLIDRVELKAQKEWKTGVQLGAGVNYRKIYSAPYVPFLNQSGEEIASVQTGELNLNFRYAHNEEIIVDDFDRTPIGGYDPVFTFQATKGIKNFLGGDYDYLNLQVGVYDKIKLNPAGYSYYYFQAGRIWGDVPFPLLKIHEGNETYAYDANAFNLMSYQEFVSDTYASLFWEHHFMGFFLNKVPLLRKLKWREVVGTRMLWGNFDANKHDQILLPGNMKGLENQPYTELSAGVENIFKFLRVDGVWRFNYKEQSKQQFGLFFSLQIRL